MQVTNKITESARIESLQKEIDKLKEQFRNTKFDQETFNERLSEALCQYDRSIQVEGKYLIDVIPKIIELTKEGYTFSGNVTDADSGYSGDWFTVRLQKPVEVVQVAVDEIEETTRIQYLERLDRAKAHYIEEIAKQSVELEEAIEALKQQLKRENKYEKALERLTKELTGTAPQFPATEAEPEVVTEASVEADETGAVISE